MLTLCTKVLSIDEVQSVFSFAICVLGSCLRSHFAAYSKVAKIYACAFFWEFYSFSSYIEMFGPFRVNICLQCEAPSCCFQLPGESEPGCLGSLEETKGSPPPFVRTYLFTIGKQGACLSPVPLFIQGTPAEILERSGSACALPCSASAMLPCPKDLLPASWGLIRCDPSLPGAQEYRPVICVSIVCGKRQAAWLPTLFCTAWLIWSSYLTVSELPYR